MGFTTAEEAGNPNSHFIGMAVNAFFIACKKFSKMLLQLTGYNVLFQFLTNVFLITLTDLDYPFQVTVDLFSKHLL